MTIKKNGVSMILDARKENNSSMMLYLKSKLYDPEGQVTHIKLIDDKKYGNDEK